MSARSRAALAVAALLLVAGATQLRAEAVAVDARDAGVPWWWLVFGFAAQAAFAARFLVQWIASERAGVSVVPRSFWLLSILGGAALFVYFVRRGDPVGATGQAFGVFIYVRNLALIARARRKGAASPEEGARPPLPHGSSLGERVPRAEG